MKKTKGKTAVIVISCLLVMLMGVSLIASIGRRGSHGSSGTSPGWSDSTIDSGGGGSGGIEDEEDGSCLHRDANDDSLCDYCFEPYSDGAEGIFGGTVITNLTFDDSVSFDYTNKDIVEGTTCAIKYGSVTTEDGYLKFYTQDSDVGITNDSYFSFNFVEEDSYVSLYSCDYISIDFDFWSDGTYINNTVFSLFGENVMAERVWSKDQNLKIVKDNTGSYLTLSLSDSGLNFGYLDNTAVHVTYVIKINHEDISQSQIKIYLNGEFITDKSSLLSSDFFALHHLRMIIGRQAVKAGESICFDNLKVCKFGDGTGYDGELAKLFESDTAKLQDNADSVLAIKEGWKSE